MRYRSFGHIDFAPSALGFGAMRLPLQRGDALASRRDHGQIDEDAATEMLRWAVDRGVNYVDTAYGYHEGASEHWLAGALRDGYRQRVKLATKMPVWQVERREDLDRFLDEQVARLGSAIDFYLLHGLRRETWRRVSELGVLDWARGALADGRISHLGFSFHDQYEVFEPIVDAAPDLWAFCQIQLNYMDVEYQAGLRGLRYAAQRGLGVVVMEPIRGGQLAKEPPRIKALWDEAPVRRSSAEWALRWVWDHPEVSLALSGMSSLDQVRQNVGAADRSGCGCMSADELALIERVRETYREQAPIGCTGCRYCAPCPNGVDVARILELYDDAYIYDDVERQRMFYGWIDLGARADQCEACGDCEARCPQMLEVREWLRRADVLLRAQGEEG